jgi:hypothetical protein
MSQEGADREELNNLSLAKEEEKRKHYRKGMMTLVGGCILELFLGCFFLWGNISIYVMSYFYEKDPSTSYNFIFAVDTVLVFSIWFGY